MIEYVIVVFYLATGVFTASFGNKATCEYWAQSNATQLHGALYASECTPVEIKRAPERNVLPSQNGPGESGNIAPR